MVMRDCPFHKAHYLKDKPQEESMDNDNDGFQTPKASKLRKRNNKKNAKSAERSEDKSTELEDNGKKFEVKQKPPKQKKQGGRSISPIATRNRFDVIGNDQTKPNKNVGK